MAEWYWDDLEPDWPYPDEGDDWMDEFDELLEEIVESGDVEEADVYPHDLFL